jgi:hypothetical protein
MQRCHEPMTTLTKIVKASVLSNFSSTKNLESKRHEEKREVDEGVVDTALSPMAYLLGGSGDGGMTTLKALC